jgi:hypothetical protein
MGRNDRYSHKRLSTRTQAQQAGLEQGEVWRKIHYESGGDLVVPYIDYDMIT